MPERRLKLSAQDATGATYRGELVIGADLAWFQPDAQAAFSIALLREPIQPGESPDLPPSVAICVPDSAVKLPAAVGEPRAPYGDEDETSLAIRLPKRVLDAYCRGKILTAEPLTMTAADVFSNRRQPHYSALGEALIAFRSRAESYWTVLAEVLSNDKQSGHQLAKDLRATVRKRLSQVRRIESPRLDRLARVVEGELPSDIYSTNQALAEDAAFLRCLVEREPDALRLEEMRAYLDAIRLAPASLLNDDIPFTREQLSFVALVGQPHLLRGMQASFESFRARYIPEYVRCHDDYWQRSIALSETLAEGQTTADALGRLIRLTQLGAPVGVDTLREFADLRCGPYRCEFADLAPALRTSPTCPGCHIAHVDEPPTERVRRVTRALEGALAQQQDRLAGAAVRQILARGGERIQQFLNVVQASDLNGLARVLDEDLLSFLDDLLDAEESAAAS